MKMSSCPSGTSLHPTHSTQPWFPHLLSFAHPLASDPSIPCSPESLPHPMHMPVQTLTRSTSFSPYSLTTTTSTLFLGPITYTSSEICEPNVTQVPARENSDTQEPWQTSHKTTPPFFSFCSDSPRPRQDTRSPDFPRFLQGTEAAGEGEASSGDSAPSPVLPLREALKGLNPKKPDPMG